MSGYFSEAFSGLRDMAEAFYFRLPHTIFAIAVFFTFYFVSKLVRRIMRRFAQRRTRHQNLAFIIGRLAQAGLIVLGVLIALVIAFPTFKPGQLVQLLGISGVAIGFAFRDILQNFLAGVILLYIEPFRIGDQIKYADFEGIVEEIETRATTIRTYDNRRIVIPNASLFTNPIVVNTAYDNRRIELDFGIGYGDDIGRAKDLILEAVRSLEEVLAEPAPDVLVTGFAASSVNLRVRWWIQPPRRFEALVSQDKISEAIKKKLIENGIDLPFETRTILFHDQTDEFDGDRARQREGWPAGPGKMQPRQFTISRALRELNTSIRRSRDAEEPEQTSGSESKVR